ncbi:bifunctional folylpolyglutamate synthase/dihydrofolate synthase [Fuerstiella marisgermanici]|uniref:Dihydrofolate synthase/folylpolyglutamate synthase n=1 Tax=Fuerstiella marisgermanici TaxID=1891926 RepID=A0A1P8WB43_9PLAN|nr:folylpolyglutamate synthase/dihydrofolate synthase family protein [Fuerstiella marisgermanici]APZ91297.1 Folylpolyglutamate synthase [Fuerstiella marisgermanici]
MDEALPAMRLTYESAIRWIYDRIDYERIRPRRTSPHFRLERIERLLSLIGSPQQRIPAVHIAGTKGKGSTAAILDSILRCSDIRTGLFTSPHIHQFEERMKVSGQMPSREDMTAMVSELRLKLADAPAELLDDNVTFFEVATLLAWMFFDRQQVEIAVLETGLGGRLDCTNVCNPRLTIITSIGLDHTHILGDTLPKIAFEKAGIIKPGVPVLSWVQQLEARKVVADRAAELGCRLLQGGEDISVICSEAPPAETGRGSQQITIQTPQREYSSLTLNLAGRHQARNAGLAVTAAELLSEGDSRITEATIAKGVAGVEWPLRFEIFQSEPTIVLDAAHNPDSVTALVETFRAAFGDRATRVLIFGSSQDKDAQAMLKILMPEFSHVIVTEFLTNPRAVARQQLLDWATTHRDSDCGKISSPSIAIADSPAAALQAGQATCNSLETADSIICVAGSVFLAAEVRELLVRNKEPQP